MLADFHVHTVLSDGTLTPIEAGRRLAHNGFKVVAFADHVGFGSMERIITEVKRDCDILTEEFGIVALPGVELTHVPPSRICTLAKKAKEMGAKIVVVHGETLVEPVPGGTNDAALACGYVDILAHPGIISHEQVELAKKNNVFLEITSRQGHCLANGHVVSVCREVGALSLLIVNSDTHSSADILTDKKIVQVALGAGLRSNETNMVLRENVLLLLRKLGINLLEV
ncbi:MAG: histidinol phosphate phosphatase domain-containing protein [Nitrososphaerota archaeon]